MLFSKLNLDPGETIILEVRRHWFVFLTRVVITVALAILPVIIYILFLGLAPLSAEGVSTIESYFFPTLFLYCLWLLLLWLILFIQWTNYYLDVWHITEKRIIDVDQKGIFHREVSNLRFDKIQDISIEVKGIIPTFFNFGNLRVQTAAEDSSSFYMKNAAHPEEVRRIIFSRHNKEAEREVDGAGLGKHGGPEIIDVSDSRGNREPL